MMRYLMLLSLILLAGCFQTYSDGDGLRTVPVTNNPNIIPNHGSMGPGPESF